MISREPNIKPWSDLSGWRSLAKQLNTRSSELIKNVPAFEKLYNELSDYPSINLVISILSKESFAINVFVYLLRNNPDYYSYYLINIELINFLQNHLTESSVYIQRIFKIAFLENLYKELPNRSEVIERLIKSLNDDELISTQFLNESGLLSEDPIQKFAKYCVDLEMPPKEVVFQNRIEISFASQTFKKIETLYVLEKLKSENLNIKSGLPRELQNGGYFDLPYNKDGLLGHELIRRILSKINSTEIHEDWIDLILKVADDPRSSKRSIKYIKWWSKISDDLIQRFIKILSHNDIILFLEAIQDFAEETNNIRMQRMYESRKKLLMGLAVQGVIDSSRLILPTRAQRFIKKKRPELDQSFIIDLNAHDGLCAIYLRIGNLHIIEGSHNFAMRIYNNLDVIEDLMNPIINYKSYEDLNSIDNKYYLKTRRERMKLNHDQQGNWKRKAIEIISSVVDIDVDLLLTDNEYFYLNIRN